MVVPHHQPIFTPVSVARSAKISRNYSERMVISSIIFPYDKKYESGRTLQSGPVAPASLDQTEAAGLIFFARNVT